VQGGQKTILHAKCVMLGGCCDAMANLGQTHLACHCQETGNSAGDCLATYPDILPSSHTPIMTLPSTFRRRFAGELLHKSQKSSTCSINYINDATALLKSSMATGHLSWCACVWGWQTHTRTITPTQPNGHILGESQLESLPFSISALRSPQSSVVVYHGTKSAHICSALASHVLFLSFDLPSSSWLLLHLLLFLATGYGYAFERFKFHIATASSSFLIELSPRVFAQSHSARRNGDQGNRFEWQLPSNQ